MSMRRKKTEMHLNKNPPGQPVINLHFEFVCADSLGILPLVVVTEKKTGERTSSMRPQFMKTSIFKEKCKSE